MSHADPGSGGGRGPAACRDMSLAWHGNPRGRRVGGLPEASWKSWDGARPLRLCLPPGSAMGPGWGGWGPPRSVLPKEQTLPRSPPFKQKENSLGGEARGGKVAGIGTQASGPMSLGVQGAAGMRGWPPAAASPCFQASLDWALLCLCRKAPGPGPGHRVSASISCRPLAPGAAGPNAT